MTSYNSNLSIAGARPANGISIEFEIRSKFAVLCNKISLWSVEYFVNKIITNLHLIFEFDQNMVSGMATCGPFY